MILLLDLGNHRLKWQIRARAGDPPTRGGAAALAGDWEGALAADLGAAPPPRRAFVASVAGRVRTEALRRLLEERGVRDVVSVRSAPELAGVRNGYRESARLGVDRWCALVAAYRLAGGAVLVADIGTAWTYDLVDAEGRHLGGWIVPGPLTQRWSLHAATAGLPFLRDEGAEASPAAGLAWGRDTEEAIRAGGLALAQGFLDTAEAFARRTLGALPARVATGGERPTVALLRERGYRIVEDLVLEGLALYAQGEERA